MLPSYIFNNQVLRNKQPRWNRYRIADNLMSSREIFNVQTIGFDVMTVSSMDLDLPQDVLLVGTTSGNVSLQQITDPTDGTMVPLGQLQMGNCNLHRVQWHQGNEQFFSTLDNHCLVLIDASEMRPVEIFPFNIKTSWSDWNLNDTKLIAVCGTESQVRLVDIRSGSSIHSITVSAQSGLKTHRASRCLWSRQDTSCIIVGDNEGYIHIYDTRHTTRSLLCSNKELGQISGMSFTQDNYSFLTSHGTRNDIVHWTFDKCSLKALPKQFSKELSPINPLYREFAKKSRYPIEREASQQQSTNASANSTNPTARASMRKRKSRSTSAINTETYLKCQFYVSESLVFVPAHPGARKSIEVFVNCLKTGALVKIIKSEEIFTPGTNSITGLLPDSLALYVGGGGRLRVWAMDEDFERKMRERLLAYEQEDWDSEEEAAAT